MSEPAPESSPPQRGSGLSKKYAGLPGWAWLGLAGAGAIAFWLWRNHQASTAAASTAAPAGGVNAVDYSGEVATLQSEIQNLQQGSNPPSTDTDVKRQWTPKVTNGRQTLDQLAKANGTSTAEMFSWMRESPATEQQVRDFIEWYEHPQRKLNNLTYYVPAAPTTTTTTDAAQAAGQIPVDQPANVGPPGPPGRTGPPIARTTPRPRTAPKPPPRKKKG
jgi:hypothetical protein